MRAPDRVDWKAAQQAVADVAGRFTTMLRSVGQPDAPAVGTWNLTDTAVHVSHVIDGLTAVTQGGGGLLEDVWGFTRLTAAMVEGETERNLVAIAARIDASIATFLTLMHDAPEDGPRTWVVRGVVFPLSTVTCHVLNELLVHGRDVAQAAGVPWKIDAGHAALAVGGFVLPVLGTLRSSMVDQEAARRVRATYALRVRGGRPGRFVLRFADGDFSVTPGSPSGPVDCHLSVDPVAFLLVSWNRISQWRAIPRGQLLAWGRRPWLGLKLRALLRNP